MAEGKRKQVKRVRSKWGEEYFGVSQALELLGKGAVVAAFVVIPGVAVAGKYLFDLKDWIEDQEAKGELKELKHYDRSKLRQTFKRLHQQKDVIIAKKGGVEVVELTVKGKRRWLQYKLSEMKLEKSSWDGKWRLISYDISKKKGRARNVLRGMLKKLECKELHHSLYLTPYRCEDEINYLREVFGVGDEVVLIVASKIEGEAELKREFGLK